LWCSNRYGNRKKHRHIWERLFVPLTGSGLLGTCGWWFPGFSSIPQGEKQKIDAS
jgi:hypothetical protein